MLRLFRRSTAGDGQASADNGGTRMDLAVLAELINCFPIGKRLNYYPEFKDNIKLESILLGYMIDERPVFSGGDIRIQGGDKAVRIFLADGKGGEAPLRDVSAFAFILPDANADTQLDYMRRAELDRVGCFRPGNAITLISSKHIDGTASLDTEVHSVQTLRNGVYAKHRLALLVAQPETLKFTEQRQYQRVEVRVPATLRTQHSELPHECMLLDFAETSMRIGFARDSELAALLRDGRQMVLTLALGANGRRFVIDGTVRRAGDDCLIMTLGRLQNGERFKSLSMLDALDIKASLLDHLSSLGRGDTL